MTIQQMRSEMQKKYETLKAMKISVDNSGRTASQAEKEAATRLLDEIDDLDISIRTEETGDYLHQSQRAPTRPDLGNRSPMAPTGTPGKHFRSFGEQLQAVQRASKTGEKPDSRLYEIRAATGMSEAGDAGFLVEDNFSSNLLGSVFEVGKLGKLCLRIPISRGNNLKIPMFAETSRATGSRFGAIRAYWLAESGTKTASMPKFRQLEVTMKKLIGLAFCSDELLEDAQLLERVVKQGFTDEFSYMIDDGIVNGSGAGQMLGFLSSGSTVNVARATAGTITSADVLSMYPRVINPGQAVWLANSDTLPSLYQMTIGGTAATPVFLPAGGLSQSPYPTLMGRPLILCEQCPTLASAGSLIFANLAQGYLLVERGGMEFASSIHVNYVQDETARKNEGAYGRNTI